MHSLFFFQLQLNFVLKIQFGIETFVYPAQLKSNQKCRLLYFALLQLLLLAFLQRGLLRCAISEKACYVYYQWHMAYRTKLTLHYSRNNF